MAGTLVMAKIRVCFDDVSHKCAQRMLFIINRILKQKKFFSVIVNAYHAISHTTLFIYADHINNYC